jgi:hypothetical protein
MFNLNLANRDYVYLSIVLGIALLVRTVFIVTHPVGGGDWDIYSTVAENILRGCGVSLSPPTEAECIPHFGGNQLPGFPAFVALVWFLFDHSDMAVRFIQALLYATALAWLMFAVAQYSRNANLALLVGFVMALSPLQIAWPRFTQTETLALATHLWVAAELLLSIAAGRLRYVTLAAALTGAVFIRLDGVLLVIPTLITIFFLPGSINRFRAAALISLLFALPLAGWAVRNVVVGLPSIFPTGMVLPNNAATPVGYIAWGRSWVTQEYQRMGWAWPVNRMVYSGIVIDSSAYDNELEKQQVERWLEVLKTFDGQPFPRDIDQKFHELSQQRNLENPLRAYLTNNALRAHALWSNPFSSFAWPNELPSDFGHQARLEVARGGIGGVALLAAKYPFEAITKGLTGTYRILLITFFFPLALWAVLRIQRNAKIVLMLGLSVVVSRTLFFAITNNVETRYTVQAVPWMELGIIFFLSQKLWPDRFSSVNKSNDKDS